MYARTESLLTLCNRHPANIPALITEIEWKLEQDTYLVSCIQDKLWEHAMEKQTYLDTFKHLKSLIKEGAESHNKLLEYRYSVKKSLAHQGIEDQKKLLALQNGTQTPIRARKVDQSRGAVQTLEVGTMGNSEVSLYGAVLIPPFLSAASPILLSRTSLILIGTSVSLYLTLPTVHTSSSLFTTSQTNSSSNSLQLAKMEVCHLLYFLPPSVSFLLRYIS